MNEKITKFDQMVSDLDEIKAALSGVSDDEKVALISTGSGNRYARLINDIKCGVVPAAPVSAPAPVEEKTDDEPADVEEPVEAPDVDEPLDDDKE